MFTRIIDSAVARWQESEGTYAVAVDDSAQCPAGDWGTGRNCARRTGGGWHGYTSVLDVPHVEFQHQYNGHTFTAAAGNTSRGEAEMIARAFAHWAEGDVYLVGFEPRDGGAERYVSGVYTQDGTPPTLAEVKETLS